MIFFLQILSSKITQYVALAVSIFSAVAVIRRSGKLEEKNNNLQKDMQDIAKRNEVVNAVNHISDDDINKRLRNNWQRD